MLCGNSEGKAIISWGMGDLESYLKTRPERTGVHLRSGWRGGRKGEDTGQMERG